VLVVPELPAHLHELLQARWQSIRRLVVDAQHVQGIELVIIVAAITDRVEIAMLIGLDAVVAIAEVAPWAAPFMRARPWVPLLVMASSGAALVFAKAAAEN